LGEGSKDLHIIVKTIAAKARALGWDIMLWVKNAFSSSIFKKLRSSWII
jgi:hypothetical protein